MNSEYGKRTDTFMQMPHCREDTLSQSLGLGKEENEMLIELPFPKIWLHRPLKSTRQVSPDMNR